MRPRKASGLGGVTRGDLSSWYCALGQVDRLLARVVSVALEDEKVPIGVKVVYE
jgi:hypothetical protein